MSFLKRKAGDTPAGSEAKKSMKERSITSFFDAPKSTAAGTTKGAGAPGNAPATPKFDKQKWVTGLTAEQRRLLTLEITMLHDSWLAHLTDELTSPQFLDLKRFLEKEDAAGNKWFPPPADVYSWSRHTPLNNVKVVIIGQDPYHNVGQAHGLAFSVREPTPAPPSLKNIFKAIKNDYPSFAPPPKNGGLLTPWADRGVLLLNTSLTVRAHEASSHSKRGWERLTQRVIGLVAARQTRGVVFLAWGAHAAECVSRVDKGRHLILKAPHPSPLSAARGFFDCGHFRAANKWLIDRYGPDAEIDWSLSPGVTTKAAASDATSEGEGTESISKGDAKTKKTDAKTAVVQAVEVVQKTSKTETVKG